MNKLISILAVLLIASSCKSFQKIGKIVKDDSLENMVERKLNIGESENYSLEQIDLRIRGDEQRNLGAKVYISKGNFIFLSVNFLGFEVARAQISPDSVKYINRIQREYFFGKIDDLKKVAGINIGYHEIESLLISGLPLKIGDTKSTVMRRFIENDSAYRYTLVENESKYINVFFTKNPLIEYKIELSDRSSGMHINGLLEQYMTSPVYPGFIRVTFTRNNLTKDIEISINKIENKPFRNNIFRINSNYNELAL